MSRVFLYGSSKGTPFQRSTITSHDVPMPNAQRPGAAAASDAAHCAISAGRARVRRQDGRTDAQTRLPRRREDQRRQPVGTVRLARPHVGVAEVGQLVVDRLVLATAERRTER